MYQQLKAWFLHTYKRDLNSKEITRFIPEWVAGKFLEDYPFMWDYEAMINDVCELLNEEFVNEKRRLINNGNMGRTTYR
jgi:hypothetical protein